MIPTTRITTQQWVSHTAPTLSMYHSQNSSFITLLRFEESSISEVLVWQCNIKTMQNPTNIVDLCPSGQEVYFSRERWQVQCLQGRNVKTNFAATVLPIFLIKIQKMLNFFFLFLSSSIAPWVQAKWTNMCLNLVMQKIKIMNLFCLPEYSILIGHYETTGLRSIFTLLSRTSHVNNTFYFGVDPIHLCGMSTGL